MTDFDDIAALNIAQEDEIDFDDDVATEITKHAPPEIEWFHGKISRDEATELLKDEPTGTYLVRESIRHVGDYSISFKTDAVKHFRIISHDFGGYFIADNGFQSLGEVVEFYCNHYLCDNTMLETPLRSANPVQAQKARKVVHAKMAYQAYTADELSFLEGDRMTVLNDTDPHWLLCSRQGAMQQTGFVPREHVEEVGTEETEREAAANCQLPPQFQRTRWLHGRISRDEAKDIVMGHDAGAFLIRESSSSVGSYAITVKLRGSNVKHLKISPSETSRYSMGDRHFDCLEAIVLRYIHEPILDDLRLRAAVPAEGLGDDGEGIDLYSDVQYSKVQGGVAVGKNPSAPPKPVPALDKGRLAGHSNSSDYSKMGYITRKIKRSKKWKPMYFALQSSLSRLLIFDNLNAIKPKGIIDLKSSFLTTLDDSLFGRPNGFQIVVSGNEVYLCTDTAQQRDEWLAALYEHCIQAGIGRPIVETDKKTRILSLSVRVIDVKDTSIKSGQIAVVLSLNGHKHARTRGKALQNKSVLFDEGFSFDNISDSITEVKLELVPTGRRKAAIGHMIQLVSGLTPNHPKEEWFALTSESGAPAGKARVKFNLIDETILPLANYAKLQAEIERPDMDVQVAMSDAFKGQLNQFATHLVTVWIASGKDVTLLKCLLRKFIAQDSSVGTLFRGNTLATKAVDQYMKVVAIDYLRKTIGDLITNICEDRRSCEMDPSRGGKSADAAKVLTSHCTALCRKIFTSAGQCPSTLRQVFADLQAAVLEKFPTDPNVRYTSVSAFLFLRLFCPAIINPKLFNMMSDHPTDTLARNLTLIAKTIQNLANMTEFGQKEPYMQPMNSFIIKHRRDMQLFLDAVSKPTRNEPVKPSPPNRDLSAIVRMCVTHEKALEEQLSKSRAGSSLPVIVEGLKKQG